MTTFTISGHFSFISEVWGSFSTSSKKFVFLCSCYSQYLRCHHPLPSPTVQLFFLLSIESHMLNKFCLGSFSGPHSPHYFERAKSPYLGSPNAFKFWLASNLSVSIGGIHLKMFVPENRGIPWEKEPGCECHVAISRGLSLKDFPNGHNNEWTMNAWLIEKLSMLSSGKLYLLVQTTFFLHQSLGAKKT